jgi:hypothetical protein
MAEISPLRRRMIEDTTVRNLSPATQRSYLAAVLKLSRYFDRSPDCLELEDIRAFQVHLVAIGISWPACGLQQGIAVAPALLTALQPSDEITGSKARYLSLSPHGEGLANRPDPE